MAAGLPGKFVQVIFRVDASLQIGMGHVMRCLTLAQTLKESGVNVEFICRQHKGNLISKIRSSGFNVYELESLEENEVDNKLPHSHWLGVTQQQDADDCIDILKAVKTDWLIVDHYALDEDWQCKLGPYYEKLMVIDDLADRKHQCNVLLDQTFGRQKNDYIALVPINCKLLLGSQYALLRPEFAKWREFSLERRSKPEFKSLLINMGGVDADNITGKILEVLKTCALPSGMSITVVMGKYAPHTESVRAVLGALPYKAEVRVDVNNMAEIMANADMAIGAAGSTTWERCCLGLPTIQVVIANNQKTIAKLLKEKNAIKLLQNKRELPSIIEDSTSWMKDMSYISKQISDGLGSERVMNTITGEKL